MIVESTLWIGLTWVGQAERDFALGEPQPSAAVDPEQESSRAASAEDASRTSAESEASATDSGDAGAPQASEALPAAPQGPADAAVGGQGYQPLPPPPSAEDPAVIDRGPWRGRFWVGLRVDVTVPVGGDQPARGEVVSGGGTLEFGWRINNWIGLRSGIGTMVHSAQRSRFVDELGFETVTVDYGQLLAFELLAIRLYWPTTGRFQPYLDATGGLALLFPPIRGDTETAALGRLGIGFDGWVSPNFTLGMDTGYRILGTDDSLGHALQIGGRLGIHW